MIDQAKNNQIGQNEKATAPGLEARFDKFMLDKNEWRNLNGGCPILSSLDDTLKNLSQAVLPPRENLSGMIRASILKYAQDGQTIDQIWQEKIAEGANFVGIVDGVFSFYRGNEKLKTANKPLRISAMPPLMQFKEQEKEMMMENFRAQRLGLMESFKSQSAQLIVGGAGEPVVDQTAQQAAQVSSENQPAAQVEPPSLNGDVTRGQIGVE